MEYSRIQKIALGTAQFGSAYGATNKDGQVSLEKVSSILRLAVRHGVDTVDTAMGYGDSEVVLGLAGVNKFKVVTKLPPVPKGERFVAKWINAQIRDSLKRLNLEKVYGLLLHRPAELVGINGPKILDSLKALQREGLTDKIGISIYHPEELAAFVAKWPFSLVQAPFNLLDRRLAKTGWLGRLSDFGVELHVRSVFLQGLLLQPAQDIPGPFSRKPEVWKKWHAWLLHHGLHALDACLTYAKSFPEISRIIVGVDNPSQWESILFSRYLNVNVTWPEIETEEKDLILPYQWPKNLPESVS